ncbi:NEDD4-binding protein 2 isoform X2 [Mastacembelus armatus]|uniref:NEDD4-binding protein 2 isoform X2 n=1 Tax=Mastacembelus armatus TaxID=205130 RepID=UPI000E45404E|nr:NEDD4-binding protein 2 isoform X2 [Mastacembelus armatus]
MPRRKKNGQSPARVPIGPSEGGSLGNTTAYRPPQGYDGVMANSSPSSSGLTSSAKENIVKNMQEMFSHLDPEVIYIVLSECDFKVEHAMDSLLELSVAAEVAAPVPSRVCGFERTAAALLSPHHFSEPRRDPDSFKPSQQPPSPSSINLLTDELDVLVDQELETLTAQQGVGKEHNLGSQHLSAGVSLSSFPPPPIPQQALPELLQSSLEPRPRKPSAREPGSVGSLVEHMSGASSPLDQLSTWKDETTERQELVVDFTHLTTQTTVDKQIPPLDLAASGRPSAFQVYKKQHPPHCLSEQVLSSDTVVGGARFKANAVNQGPLGYLSSVWNLEAPEFSPRVHANPDPAFITPVAQPPSNWFSQHRHASPWLGETHVSRAPLKPFATIPKSWALPAAPQPPAQYSKFRLEGKVLVLLRGAPGSGKTTMARTLLQHNQGGVILSTDDYFFHHGKYQFDPTALGEAHVWNHERAKEAFGNDTNPIIIDNTNMQAWEMKPYVIQALKYGYKVLFREPETWWKNKPRELQRRTTHNVQVETIRRMLNGYDRFVTVQTIMGSQMPEWKQCLHLLLDSGESFFRDEDGEEEKNGSGGEDDQNTPSLCDDLGEVTETRSCAKVLDECQSEDLPKEGGPSRCEEGTEQSTPVTVSESNRSCSDTCLPSFEGVAAPGSKKDHPDTTSELEKSPQTELYLPEATEEREKFKKFEHKEISESDLEVGAWGWSSDDGVVIEESVVVTEDEIASMDEIHRLLQMELEEMEREEKGRKEESSEKRHQEERRGRHLDIQSVELKLPTELALQLAELFGPVGVDPGTCSTDDYSVHMDMNLAKLLHQKWKETIQERQRQTSLSFHLLQDSSVHGGKSQLAKPGLREPTQPASGFSNTADGYVPLDSQPEAHSQMPFMDHWNVSRVPNNVSLRDIIKEEQLLQQNREKNRQSRVDLDQRDTATLLKENQLYSLFPTIDRHFLQDIFRDHNYSLSQTELFLRSLLDEEPIKTVVAPETVPSVHHRAVSKEREKKQKRLESIVPDYQDTEDPDYDDFRTEASLQRSRQMESFAKAAEAYKQGRKEVASFYAQQGHLHGARMREANHRAAAQIFERVNSSLLPSNILDLHGLHVDEALQHLAQVLQDKTTDCERGLCRPQLSVITGRGNHSQGGVARIRPAVIDYLTNKHYRFTEPKPGLVLISLK